MHTLNTRSSTPCWPLIAKQSALAVLLVLVGYHSAPGSRTLDTPALADTASTAPRAAPPRSPFGDPQAPFDDTVITPTETVGAPSHG